MTVEDIEKAIAKLPPDQLAQFRVWFEEFDSALFHQKIRRDAVSGKLDRLAEQAIDTSATSPTRTSRSRWRAVHGLLWFPQR